MKLFTRSAARSFLSRHGMLPGTIETVLNGFDFGKPVYDRLLLSGELLYQYIRLSSASMPFPQRGNWYALAGGTQAGVAIFSGLAGRRLHKFEVVAPFSALEGTALALPVDWDYAIGGLGGSTQIYVPQLFAGRIQAIGPAEGGS